jgi:hypothetical protein
MSPAETSATSLGKHVRNIDRAVDELARRTRFTKYQLFLLCLFPLIILLGQIMAYGSPDETVHNYFTAKGNLVNSLYVKKGWFWTLLAYSNLVYHKVRRGTVNRKLILTSVCRVIFITIGWFLFTQWCWGLPIMDRIFLLTGGKCVDVSGPNIPSKIKGLFLHTPQSERLLYHSGDISSATCRSLKGTWSGGHDPSGHVFLLSLSASLLLHEFIHLYRSEDDDIITLYLQHRLNNFQAASHHAITTIVFSLMALGMLLMTAIKYHSLVEQLAGLLVALIVIWASNQVSLFIFGYPEHR